MRDISKFVFVFKRRKIILIIVEIFIFEVNNIFENIGVKGNFVIWSLSGDVRLLLLFNVENIINLLNSWLKVEMCKNCIFFELVLNRFNWRWIKIYIFMLKN